LDAAAYHILAMMAADSALIRHLQLVEPFGAEFGNLNFSTQLLLIF
jgi:hypothetical protein